MIPVLLLSVALLASDSVPIVDTFGSAPIPKPRATKHHFPVYTTTLGLAGLAGGVALFMPVAYTVAAQTRGGCDGYGCMGNGILGLLTGVGVVVVMPALGLTVGEMIDAHIAASSDHVGLEVTVPLGRLPRDRHPPDRAVPSSTMIAYSFPQSDSLRVLARQ